ncbi:696_t:CDS:2, partial [Scutellospora calospora]
YKAKTIKQAVDRINRYINKNEAIHGFNLHNKYQFSDLYDILNSKIKDLQEKRLGIQGSDAYQIRLLSDSLGTFGLQDNSIWYSKTYCNLNKVENFMRDIEQKVKVKLPDRILTNYFRRKTAAQILQNANILEDTIIDIIRHKSS